MAELYFVASNSVDEETFQYFYPFMCYGTQWTEWEGPEKKRYNDVRFNVISVTRVWVGVKFS